MVTAMHKLNLVGSHGDSENTNNISDHRLEDMRWDDNTVVLLHAFQLVALETSTHCDRTIES